MKKYIISLVSLFIISSNIYSQNPSKGFGFGYQLSQYQDDFGFGLNFNSPYFLKDYLSVRLKGNLMYNQNVVNDRTEWIRYYNVSLGLIGVSGYINNQIRLYGEGGLITLFPNQEMSDEEIIYGGYGLFGFEFFMFNKGSYFIEIGGVGTAARANQIETSPIFSNGITLSTGFRFFIGD